MTNDESADEQFESRRFWRRVRVFVLYPLLSVSLLIVVTVGWLMARNAAAQKKVDDLIEQLRAQGLPVDNASLMAYRDGLTSTKDLSEWLKVLITVESNEFKQSAEGLYPWSDAEAPLPGDPWPEQERVQDFLQRWQDLLNDAGRLAQADIKRRTPMQADGLNTNLEWESKVRQLARLFQLQAAAAIYRRDSAETRDALLNLLGCAMSVEGQPMLIGQLIAVAVEAIALEQLQRAIEFDVLNAEDLKRVRERLEMRTSWRVYWQLGIAGERALALPTFFDTERYLGEDARPFSMPLPWRASDEMHFLQLTNRSAALPTDDLTKFRDANNALSQDLERLFRKGSWTTKFDHLITNMVLPAYGSYGEALVQREMRCRLAILAIGVREYQAKLGKLPDALADLEQVGVDATKLTPPGTKPFGFRKLDSAVALWGFQSRSIQSTPDDPPDVTAPDRQWDRMWLWQMDE